MNKKQKSENGDDENNRSMNIITENINDLKETKKSEIFMNTNKSNVLDIKHEDL